MGHSVPGVTRKMSTLTRSMSSNAPNGTGGAGVLSGAGAGEQVRPPGDGSDGPVSPWKSDQWWCLRRRERTGNETGSEEGVPEPPRGT